MVSDKKIFQDYLYISLCENSGPRVGTIFDSKAKICTLLVEGPLDEATYQIR